MSENLILHCPSKLNLTLDILKKKENGMHEIKSHFQLIDLYDVMYIEKSNAQQSSIRTNASIDIDSKKNLVYQAIEALSKHVSQELYCNIIIEKNIPIGGGLGGGSSNAAAALIGINKLFSLQLDISELINIGLKLGADVPFFVLGKNAIATGIGEQLSEVNSETNKFLVISPPIHSSTQEMFQTWDELHEQDMLPLSIEDENPFLQIFLQKNPEIKAIFKELAVEAPFKLSGTGSTIFCVVKNDERMKKTLKKFQLNGDTFFANHYNVHHY